MCIWLSLAERQKKICHVLSQIPTVNRSAIHHNKAILEIEFAPSLRARFVTKPEQFQISTAWHHFVDYIPAAQAFPLINDRPDAFSKSHHTVSAAQRSPFERLCKPRRNRAFAPVTGVHVLLSHQPADIKNHFDAEPALQSQSDDCGNMCARVDQFDLVS